MYPDPFRQPGDNILVMCDCYEPPRVTEDGETQTPMKPIPTNTRHACMAAMDKAKDQEPWFGIEQEYTLLNAATGWPLGWPKGGFPGPQGPYYCSSGAGSAIGREVAEAHYKACMFAGINISGVNAEVMPAQWEFQVGPCTGIDSGDQMWMARYLLSRVGELFNVTATLDPKPMPGTPLATPVTKCCSASGRGCLLAVLHWLRFNARHYLPLTCWQCSLEVLTEC